MASVVHVLTIVGRIMVGAAPHVAMAPNSNIVMVQITAKTTVAANGVMYPVTMVPAAIPTVGVDGTTTTETVASLVAVVVVITVIVPINVERVRTVTMVTGDTATRTTVIIHSVRHVMYPVIGMIPLLVRVPGIAVGPSTKNVM